MVLRIQKHQVLAYMFTLYNVLSFMSSLANSSQVNICPVDPPVAISASPQRLMSKTANSATGCKTLTCEYVTTKLLKLAINMD